MYNEQGKAPLSAEKLEKRRERSKAFYYKCKADPKLYERMREMHRGYENKYERKRTRPFNYRPSTKKNTEQLTLPNDENNANSYGDDNAKPKEQSEQEIAKQ